MIIYLIKRTDEVCHDESAGHVIVASNKTEVIKMAEQSKGDQSYSAWDGAIITIIGRYNGKNKKPFIVLTDFNAG